MTRRQLLALAGLQAGRAAEVPYRNYSRCLPDYLASLAAAARAKRDAAIAQLTSPSAVQARQQWARDTFWQLVGGRPESTPLNLRAYGEFAREGYRVQKIAYESQPGFIVPANLYIPTTGQPPYPGVLFQMGHSANGKAAVTYQKCCQGLARLGYVVLGFDPMGQGERQYYPPRLSPDNQHTVAGRQMLLVGDTATRMQVWDAIRSLDVLAANPLVDPRRLASAGQSGGGTLTMLLICADERLAVAAVSSGNTENFACADFNAPGSSDDAEQNLIDSGPHGFDRWDLLYPFAPKPLLVLASARDFFGTYSSNYLVNGRAEFARLQSVYRVLGHADRLAWDETPLPHSLSYALRMKTYNWFERHLRHSDRVIEQEPPVHPEADETLRVGAGLGKSPREIFRARGGSLTPVLRDIGNPQPPGAVLARVASEKIEVQAIEVPSDPGVFVPGWLFVPPRPQQDSHILLVLHERGRNQYAEEGGLYHQLAAAGSLVCSCDLRGSGDLTPEFSRGAAGYARSHSSEENYAWASLILGRPLVSQRVSDILAVVRELKAHQRPIVIAAAGKMTVPALFAALHSRDISALYLSGGLVSFKSVLDADEYTQPLANFIPGILSKTDLPQVAASLAPRRVIVAGAVDGAGRPCAYPNPSANIEWRNEPAWTFEALRAL